MQALYADKTPKCKIKQRLRGVQSPICRSVSCVQILHGNAPLRRERPCVVPWQYRHPYAFRFITQFNRSAQAKAFSLRRHPRVASLALKGNSPSGARRADVVCGKNLENPTHLGEYARIIAFGDEILRRKISHHISRYATASPQVTTD